MKWFILAFILIPVIELTILLYSGKTVGVLVTLLLILLTGIGGAYLAKKQGMKAWQELKVRMARMETPGDALIDSFCIGVGGVLLILPGFVTDVFGLLLLFKGPRNLIRPLIIRWLLKKMRSGQIFIR